ncbi:hypothetical protein SDC9_157110 [bioreactor metagenome]|uniref:Uncharacterized protein n=1 Tax=bioreactor metagenome TaxID=1076179 RepID=A0A645F622_9ZZZZ
MVRLQEKYIFLIRPIDLDVVGFIRLHHMRQVIKPILCCTFNMEVLKMKLAGLHQGK